MLGKLIKYDLKSTTKFLLIIHLFLVAASVFGRVFITGRLDFEMEGVNELLLTLTFVLFIIVFVGVSYGTYIVIAVRFYKNLFSDEGYLTNTLPVTRGMHLLAKTLSGGIWAVIDMFLIFVSTWILLSIPLLTDTIGAHWDEFIRLLGFGGQGDFNLFLAHLTLVSIVGGFCSVISIEASVIFGQLFNSHKVLGAVVSYFAITVVLSVVSTVVMSMTGVLGENLAVSNASPDSMTFSFAGYMTDLLNATLGLSVATAVILYIASFFILKKRINLS
ncbi:hypothetical protein [Mordavella massiliensis]|uniref:Uncharacterized protein n=1 Tax=Mordavella massiliensis TaxID=1871024 RepID=A0A938XAC0_9CLOT|nr:hypothetical protein [Mordavella massiliensis]MBM6947838.1 hypothetical protein [Mordavella massiliensis]